MFVLSTENLLCQNDEDFSSSYFGSAFRFFICVVAILDNKSGVWISFCFPVSLTSMLSVEKKKRKGWMCLWTKPLGLFINQ